MAYCAYCNVDLPGEETVCRRCYEANYARVTAAEAAEARRRWWVMAGLKAVMFAVCLLFAYGINSSAVLKMVLVVSAVALALLAYRMAAGETGKASLIDTAAIVVLVGVLASHAWWYRYCTHKPALAWATFVASFGAAYMFIDIRYREGAKVK